MLATLRQRNFALVWTAGLISQIGDWALYAALPIFLLREVDSVFYSGLVWAVIVLPAIAIGPVAGVFVDRWNRQQTMFWANLMQAAVMLPLATMLDLGAIWIVYGVVFAQATLVTFNGPAENALLPSLVDERSLVSANALNGLNDNLGRIIGPVLGAIVLSQTSIRGVAIVNALTFVIAALLIRLVVVPGAPDPIKQDETPVEAPALSAAMASQRGIWQETLQGMQTVFQSTLLRALFLVIGVLASADAPFSAMLAAFADRTLGQGAGGYGTLLAFRGIAGLLGGVLVAQFCTGVRADRLLGIGALIVGIGILVTVLSRNFAVACIVMLLIGPAIAASQTGTITLLQRGAKPEVMGRVFALLGSASGIITLVSTLAASGIGAATSPQAVITGSGFLYVVTGITALVVLAAPVMALTQRSNPTST